MDKNEIEVLVRAIVAEELAKLKVARNAGRNSMPSLTCKLTGVVTHRNKPMLNAKLDRLTEAFGREVGYEEYNDNYLATAALKALKSGIHYSEVPGWNGTEFTDEEIERFVEYNGRVPTTEWEVEDGVVVIAKPAPKATKKVEATPTEGVTEETVETSSITIEDGEVSDS